MVKDDRGGAYQHRSCKTSLCIFLLAPGPSHGQLGISAEGLQQNFIDSGLIGRVGQQKLLQTFSGKKAVLLAMACDAAATCSEFTRALDNEEADVAQLNERCGHFALSVQALFLSGEDLDFAHIYQSFGRFSRKGSGLPPAPGLCQRDSNHSRGQTHCNQSHAGQHGHETFL